MLLGTGLAFYFGKPLIQPQAPQIPALALGAERLRRRCRPPCPSTRSFRWACYWPG